MQNQDSDVRARNHRVQDLCRELSHLVELSREQRRTIDTLLTRLEAVLRHARVHRIARGGWRPARPVAGLSPLAGMATGTGLRVLLVEDDAAFAAFLGLALGTGAEPAAVQAVGDLIGALEQIRQASPDAVVLDLNLPDSDGLATLRAVLASAPQMPIVVLTGLADVEIARQALQLGAQDWLLKGQLDPDVVQRAVRYAVERKHLTDRLVQAQKLEIAGRLANGVAHEFNNILTAIAGSAQLVEDAADADARAGALDLLRRAARQGIALSRQLLSLARNPPMNSAVVSTAGLVNGGRSLVQAVLPSTVQLEVGPVADVPVRLDPGQFDQLLLNLVLNARDAMPEGGTLRISVTAEAAHGAATESDWASHDPLYAVVRVSDTGVGIDPVHQAAALRAVFQHEGRPRYRPRPCSGRGNRGPLRRRDSRGEPARGGDHVRGPLAGRVRVSRGVVPWMRSRPSSSSGRACSSSTTRKWCAW